MATGRSEKPSGQQGGKPALLTRSRIGAGGILAATLAWGMWLATIGGEVAIVDARVLALGEGALVSRGLADPAPFWLFLIGIATPAGLALVLVVRAETLGPTRHTPTVAAIGLAGAALISAIGIVTAVWWTIDSDSADIWGFLALVTVPIGLGTLLLLSATSLTNVARTEKLAPYAIGIAGAVAVSAVAIALRNVSLTEGREWLAFLLTAPWAWAVSVLLLAIAAQHVGPRASDVAMVLSGLVIAAGIAAGAVTAADVVKLSGDFARLADIFWAAVQTSILPISVGVLAWVISIQLGRDLAGATIRKVGLTASAFAGLIAVAFGFWLAGDASTNQLWVALDALPTLIAVALLIAVEAERRGRTEP